MKNLNVLSTLFVGIGVSSKTNFCTGMDFNANVLFKLDVPNNQVGVDALKCKLLELIQKHYFESTVVALESTSF